MRRWRPALWLLLAAALLGPACGEGPPRPRHVLVVLIDTQRADRLSCFGYDRETSPGIDALARRGARFANVTAQSSWTAASMVSLFTGRHLAEECLRVPEHLPSLPVLFQEAGYDTGAFVVNPLVHIEENGFRRGFRRFEAGGDLGRIRRWILAAAERERDTFTYVHFVDPHDPYAPLPEYHRFVGEPANFPPALRAYYRSALVDLGLEGDPAALRAIERGWNGYDDDVVLVDSKVQILVKALAASGQLEDSLIVVASDHGEGLWTRPKFEHRLPDEGPRTLENTHKVTHGNQLYEELVRVPLVIAGPGVPAGVVVDAPVQNVDLLPTLCELADLPLPAGLSGRSLVALMRSPRAAAPGEGFAVTKLVVSLRSEDGLKLIEPTEEGRALGIESELYDLRTDPFERTNLAAERPAAVRALRRRIEERLATGLRSAPGEWELSEANAEAMRALGYTE